MKVSDLNKPQTLIEKVIKEDRNLVLRIPPSPTGNLHIGTARTALYNLIIAKKYAGKFVLRLEDTDRLRSKSEYVSDILNGLEWLGISWDEGPLRQSEHQARHNLILEELKKKEFAYECFCNQEELEQLRAEQKEKKQAPHYDNRHRNLTEQEKEEFKRANRKPVVRIKVPENQIVSWFDLIKGEIQVNTNDLGGDFVIGKENEDVLYNFAVVVDDHDQKINFVIRGEDHLHNTAKQIVLYQALGWKEPLFAHVPLILSTDREKLSKRKHGEIASIKKYKEEGYLPEAIVNYLVAMSWQFYPDSKEKKAEENLQVQEIFGLEEILEQFEINSISKSPAIYDQQKLEWFSREHFKKLPTEQLLKILEKYQLPKSKSLEQFFSQKEEFKSKVLGLIKDNLSKLSQVPDLVYLFLNHPNLNEVNSEDKIILCKQESKEILRNLKQILSEQSPELIDSKEILNQLSKQTKIKKGKNLFFPIRIALWGKTKGPDLGAILSILGKEELISRIQKAIEF